MALETVVFKEDPFDIIYNEIHKNWGCIENEMNHKNNGNVLETGKEPLPDVCDSTGDRDGVVVTAEGGDIPMPMTPSTGCFRRKRRRTKSPKNEDDMENQRMNHIAVERNRRRQMNDYLSVLRSLMPPSYSQRGDQASIVGGAINFIKELEQQHQFLEAKKQISNSTSSSSSTATAIYSKLFKTFFTFPQYSTSPIPHLHGIFSQQPLQKLSKFADIEVAIAESHANIKILTTKGPTQLIIIVTGLHSLSLPILHLSITTADQFVLYSFIVKVNDDSQLNSVDDIATAVNELVGMVKEGG